MSVLFFGKQGDFHCERAAEFIEMNCADATIVMGAPENSPEMSGEEVRRIVRAVAFPNAPGA